MEGMSTFFLGGGQNERHVTLRVWENSNISNITNIKPNVTIKIAVPHVFSDYCWYQVPSKNDITVKQNQID